MSDAIDLLEYERELYSRLKLLQPASRTINFIELFKFKEPAESIPSELQNLLLEVFRQITNRLYQADTSFHWKKHESFFETVQTLWIAFCGSSLVGFAAINILTVEDVRVIYIDNMNLKPLTRPVLQDYTLGSVFIHEMLLSEYTFKTKAMAVAARTQNPRIYELAHIILPRAVHPQIFKTQSMLSNNASLLAKAIAARISPGKEFNVDTSVIRQAYQASIYGNMAERTGDKKISVRRRVIANYWLNKMDVNAGDALLLIVCPTRWEVSIAIGCYAFKKGLSFFCRL